LTAMVDCLLDRLFLGFIAREYAHPKLCARLGDRSVGEARSAICQNPKEDFQCDVVF